PKEPFLFRRRRASAIACARILSRGSRWKRNPGVRASSACQRNCHRLLFLFLISASVLCSQSSDSLLPGPKPHEAAASLRAWIGEYGPDGPTLSSAAERNGALILFGEALGNCTVEAGSGPELKAKCSLQDGVSLHKDKKGVPTLRTRAGTLARRGL